MLQMGSLEGLAEVMCWGWDIREQMEKTIVVADGEVGLGLREWDGVRFLKCMIVFIDATWLV